MRCGNVRFPISSTLPPGHRSPGRPFPCWGLRVCVSKIPGVDDGIREGRVLLLRGHHVEADLIEAGVDLSQSPGSELLRYAGTLVYFGPPRGLIGTRLRDIAPTPRNFGTRTRASRLRMVSYNILVPWLPVWRLTTLLGNSRLRSAHAPEQSEERRLDSPLTVPRPILRSSPASRRGVSCSTLDLSCLYSNSGAPDYKSEVS